MKKPTSNLKSPIQTSTNQTFNYGKNTTRRLLACYRFPQLKNKRESAHTQRPHKSSKDISFIMRLTQKYYKVLRISFNKSL